MLRTYSRLLQTRPILTKAVTASLVGATGDMATQLIVEERLFSEVDWHRQARFVGLGITLAPVLHVWYGVLARKFGNQALKKVAADQLIFAPAFLGSFIFANDYLESHSIGKAAAKVNKEWVHTVLVNWAVWVPFQSLNFFYVPLPYQVLANNLAGVFWNAWLSWKLHKVEVAHSHTGH